MICVNKRSLKILSIMALLLIISSLFIIIQTGGATNYEFSIYDAYPPVFWFLIIISLFIGVSIIYLSVISKTDAWKYGILVAITADIILLTLPIARNYYIFGRADVLSHVGLIKDIMNNGLIGQNMYPMNHILVTITSFVSGVEFISNINTIFSLFIILFFFIYILFAYLLLKTFESTFLSKLSLVILIIPIFSTFNTLFAPYAQFIFLIPLFLYLYFKSRLNKEKKIEINILTVMMGIFITFFHPLGTLLTIAILLVIEFSRIVAKRGKLWKLEFNGFDKSYNLIRKPFSIVTLMLIIFFMWQTYAYFLVNSIKTIYDWLIGETGSSQFEQYSGTIAYAQVSILELIKSGLYRYGQWIILILISLIIILYLQKKKKINFQKMIYSLEFIFFSLLSILIFLSANIFGFRRIIAISMIFSSGLFYYFLKTFSKKELLKNNYIKHSFLSLILIGVIYFSIFNLYYSPLVQSPNEQLLKSDYIGMEHFFNVRNDDIYALELGLYQAQLHESIYGWNHEKKRLYWGESGIPIDHFGYDNYTSFSSSYNKTYILINDIGKYSYPELYPNYPDRWRFTDSDFKKLNSDPALQSIYQNGNLEVYLSI